MSKLIIENIDEQDFDLLKDIMTNAIDAEEFGTKQHHVQTLSYAVEDGLLIEDGE